MQAQANSAAVCPECGTRLEGGFSRGLGRCMICLLRVGFDDVEVADEARFASVKERLGNYRIEHRHDGTLWELGRGAMGVTYRAVDTSLQRPAALKLIDSEWVKRGAEARERFMHEARTAASLRHPNVATVYHFGIREENGQCFCAMELVEGETLETRVRRTGPLDALTTIDIALQVSSALAAAEKQGLVHRDLKPANLMFVAAAPDANDSSPGKAEKADTVVKVIDFGVAKALVEKPDAMGLTHGGFVGTPAFASPEQFTDARVDVRSDIYSLGATLWYLLTGHRPFEGATIEQIRASQHSQALPIEQLKAARVPNRLMSLLVSMLAPEPAARPGVHALTAQLQALRAHLTNRGQRMRRLALAATFVSLGACTILVWLDPFGSRSSQQEPTVAPNVPEKSIAVLPFENRSEDKENAFFADGMQDDVLTSLVKIKELTVIGRSSVMSYRDGTKRNLRKIGQELGVAHVLEGSVRRVADRMLIYVNLTDTRNGRAVWAERYDRTLADLTGLQGELAIEIAGALRARLAPAEKASLQTKTTENADAYVLYLRGREYQMRPENSQDNNLAAEKFYKQAIALDPRFALAYARLAVIQNNLSGIFDRRPARKAEARRNAEEAVRLDPNSGQAHMALAAVMSGSGGTPEEMKREIATAVRLLPNDAYIAMDAAAFQDDLKWFDEAAASYERAIVLNPREGKVFYNYAVFLNDRNDIPRARWASDRALELSPDSVYFRLFRARAEIEWTGDLARGKAVLADLPKGKDPDGRVTAARCSIAVWERNFPEALKLLAACSVDRMPGLEMGFGAMVPKSFIQGMVQLFAGDREGAYATLDSARWILEVEAKENAGDTVAHFLVALTYAAMGWKDAAKAEAARSKEKLDDFQMALLFAHLGEFDPALTALEGAALKPEFRRVYLRLDPDWDAVRNDPRFEKIVASLAPEAADVPAKSIAILPFENRSEDKENAFLADGMQDDVLTSLVQIKDLKVIGGSSVMSYRDGTNRNLREVGQQLNVAHVLEGSVQRNANRLLVYVKITDTRDGRSLWAERYDRTIADSTRLQVELADEIAGVLRATLGPAEKARRLQASTTGNPDAYVLYLRGREYQMRPEVSRDNYLAAENFYKQAVALDPNFALARARLAEVQLWHYNMFDYRRPARLVEARRTAEEALRLDPDCGQAHMVLAGCMKANYVTLGKQEAGDGPAAMRREVAAAVRLLPNDGYIALAAAMLQWDLEWNDEAAASFERAMVLNPREGKVFYNYSAFLNNKDISRARWASDRALELSPDSIFFRLNRAGSEIAWTGEVARAKAILAGLPPGKDPDGQVTATHCSIAVYERDFPEALRLLAACQVERIPFLDDGPMVPKGFVEGFVHFWAGHLQEAYASLDSVRWMLEVEAQENAGEVEGHYLVALVYAAMGWSDAAKAEIARCYKRPDIGQMADFFALLGDHDSALPLIEQAVSRWPPTRSYLRLHPRWDSMRADPRFQKLLAQTPAANPK